MTQIQILADLVISGNQVNFYYPPKDIYLMEYSPRVTNLESLKASLLSWTPIINIQSPDLNVETLALDRVVDFETTEGADKTFTGLTINKMYTNTLEYKIQAVLKWINSAGEENQIERVLEKGRDWCLATPNNFPQSHQVSLISNSKLLAYSVLTKFLVPR